MHEGLIENIICFRLIDLRFPEASITCDGWAKLLKVMKDTGVSSGHISIPEELCLKDNDLKSLKEFAFSKMSVRGAFRR